MRPLSIVVTWRTSGSSVEGSKGEGRKEGVSAANIRRRRRKRTISPPRGREGECEPKPHLNSDLEISTSAAEVAAPTNERTTPLVGKHAGWIVGEWRM